MMRVFVWSIVGLLAVCQVAVAEAEYLAVFMNNKKIAYAVEERVVKGQEVRTTETIFMTVEPMGITLSIQAS
jgi:hypothetical protein